MLQPGNAVGRALAGAGACLLGLAALVWWTGGGQLESPLLSVSIMSAARLVLVACVLLLLAALDRAGRGAPAMFVAALLGLMLALAAESRLRPVGDAGEYLAMSLNLARLSPPSLSADELARLEALYPGDVTTRLVMPEYRARDGRQDFPHFWFYPLLAAPFVRAAPAVGAPPLAGFAAVNLLLLLTAAWLLRARASAAVALVLAAGPILWWTDKAHTEAFTFSLLVVAVLMLKDAPWWSAAALGGAATQNPPLAGGLLIAMAYAIHTRGWRDRRVWRGAAFGLALAALHPIYYYWRLGVWSGLATGINRHTPSVRELTSVVLDPNLGILIHDPPLAVAIAAALVAAARRRSAWRFDAAHACVALIALMFLVSFTQTTNFNAGGTPDPSRYGLWLLPLALPLLRTVPDRARWMKAIGAASLIWCVIAFAPKRADEYLRPTPLAAALWQQWPSIDNPLAEVFAERVSGREPPALPPLATPGCEKVLLLGRGGEAEWPGRCSPTSAPPACRERGALCYANRSGATYRFTSAPSPPRWVEGLTASGPAASQAGEMVTVRHPRPDLQQRLQMVAWLDDGWSYLEWTEASASAPREEWRWMAERARIGVSTLEPASVRLSLVMRSLDHARRVRITLGNADVMTVVVPPRKAEFITPLVRLDRGVSVLGLDSLDGAAAPASSDSRRLSIALFRLEVAIED